MMLRRFFQKPKREALATSPEPNASAVDLEVRAAQEAYAEQNARFESYLDRIGAPEQLRRLYWYHTVDLGDGGLTPGDYDYRSALAGFAFPDDMRGMTVLDVGAATGFFSFEFERRGADVVSVELPSLEGWDIARHRRAEVYEVLARHHGVSSPEEAYHMHLRAPFDFCKERLGSKVKRVFSSIYDLTPELLGRKSFDLVFLGDILLHLFSPVAALNVVAGLTSETLIATTDLAAPVSTLPLLQFLGQHDARTWWTFNQQAMLDMLACSGFAEVRAVGTYQGVLRRGWSRYNRTVFHASSR